MDCDTCFDRKEIWWTWNPTSKPVKISCPECVVYTVAPGDPYQKDPTEGKALALQGQERALAAADDDWKAEFRAEALRLAGIGLPFTSEDVLDTVGLPTNAIGQHKNNSVGAMMFALAREGVIVKTGTHSVSQRPQSHGREITDWVGAQVDLSQWAKRCPHCDGVL